MTAIALPRQPHSAWLERLRSIRLGLGARGALGLGLGRSGVSAAGNGLLNNLVAYWKLDEAGGANDALDAHSNGLTLTQVSSPGADTGNVYSTARTFDGSLDYFSRASEALLQTGDVDFTVAAWVYITSLPAVVGGIIAKWSQLDASGLEYAVRVGNTGVPRLELANAASSVLTVPWDSALSTDTWYFVLAYHDAVNNRAGISINNATDVTSAWTTGVRARNAALRLGRSADTNGYYLAGRIGPVMMWKSAAGGGGVLSAAQRTALFNGGAGLPYSQFTT